MLVHTLMVVGVMLLATKTNAYFDVRVPSARGHNTIQTNRNKQICKSKDKNF